MTEETNGRISLKEMEYQQLKEMLEEGYSRKDISDTLKISRTTLYRRLKQYGL